MTMQKASEIISYMEAHRDEAQREILLRFFKTGEGDYGEGDDFLGWRVPQTRELACAMARDYPLDEVPPLLLNRWHEVRLCGLLILVRQFERLATRRLVDNEAAIEGRDKIVSLYVVYSRQANNWDLVDLSAPKILGHWLLLPSRLEDKRQLLDRLAHSDNLWQQRMSMVCTWKPTQQGDPSWCLRYAEMHLHHQHDLMHKAVGWMLREMGKRIQMDLLRDFLRQHIDGMPRTTLRYAIEKMDAEERMMWMNYPRIRK